MNPTQYLTRDGLRAVIRTRPGLQMPGFSTDQLTEYEIDMVIAISLTSPAGREISDAGESCLPCLLRWLFARFHVDGGRVHVSACDRLPQHALAG
jgi:hypothetical protein